MIESNNNFPNSYNDIGTVMSGDQDDELTMATLYCSTEIGSAT